MRTSLGSSCSWLNKTEGRLSRSLVRLRRTEGFVQALARAQSKAHALLALALALARAQRSWAVEPRQR